MPPPLPTSYLTNLVSEAAEDGAAVAAREPEEERGIAGGRDSGSRGRARASGGIQAAGGGVAVAVAVPPSSSGCRRRVAAVGGWNNDG